MTAYGSGLSAQLGIGAETTVGTVTTVTRLYEFLDESMEYKPTFLDSEGLKAGQAYKRATRTTISRHTAEGDFSLELVDRGGMGLLWKHMLGSQATTATQIGTTGAYTQVHTAGSKFGLSLTIQVGRPQTDATVKPFTFYGSKFPEWELSISDGKIPTLKISPDAWGESTAVALSTAGYTAGSVPFSFADSGTTGGGTFKLGGTVTTTAGVTSVTAGVSVATVVKEITITGKSPMETERFGLGNGGEKREPIENDIPTITGKVKAEFNSQSEIYDVFKANTTVALQLDLAHGTAGGANPFLTSIILPAIRWKTAAPSVDGPDIVQQDLEFEAYDDGTNPVIQVRLISTDTTL
jgi:hypothetical protein